MSVDLKLVKELRDRTGLGMNDCKRALQESDNNIEGAIDLLKTWGELKGKERANREATEGKIGMFSNKHASFVGMFEINCQTDFVANSKGFADVMYAFSKINTFAGDKAEVVRKDLMEKRGENLAFAGDEFSIKLADLVATTGENISLRRVVIYKPNSENSHITFYMHAGERLGTLIEISAPEMTENVVDFANECAMQIAAMSPLVVSKEELPEDVIARQKSIFEAQLTESGKPVASWGKIIEGKFSKWRKDVVLLEQESIKDSKKTIDQLRQEAGKDVKIVRFVRFALGEGMEKKKENLAEEVAKLTGAI